MSMKSQLATLALAAGLMAGGGTPVKMTGQAPKIPLTKKQKKQRAKNKMARKSRSINHKK